MSRSRFLILMVFLFILFIADKTAFAEMPFDFHGFLEGRVGYRTRDDKNEDKASIMEARLQTEETMESDNYIIKLRTDFILDDIEDDNDIKIEEGRGWLDLREASITLFPFDFMDLKIGRQILTWGTGDLIFINDLFPKDWNSFFIGRDDEYLKAPSDAIKASLFSDFANMDIVYTPRFDSDRYIDGRRISYYNGFMGNFAGQNAIIYTDKPDDWFDDDEIAIRIYKNVKGYELALYFYDGFWKSPSGMDLSTGKALFNKLRVFGTSIRGDFLKGIGFCEAGYYYSRDDKGGYDPFIKNSELRFLVGYEQEIVKDFTAEIQYYLEYMQDYDEYEEHLPFFEKRRDEKRHVYTLRLTKLAMNQNLTLSLFMYYSPSDEDSYLKPKIHYAFTDYFSGEIGANIFWGKEDHTFFGQFENNTNVYVAGRYGF